MNWSFIVGGMFGLFVGNFFFHGVLKNDIRAGLVIGIGSAIIYPFIYISVMWLLECFSAK